MAILVAAGGAALGTALGVGPGTGWLAGAALGRLLFSGQGPNSRVEGPRLGDLTITSAAYGAAIAIPCGTLRLAGNMIWSSGISERQNVRRTRAGGKGGGGGAQTSVSYAYFASFALSFGEGRPRTCSASGPTASSSMTRPARAPTSPSLPCASASIPATRPSCPIR